MKELKAAKPLKLPGRLRLSECLGALVSLIKDTVVNGSEGNSFAAKVAKSLVVIGKSWQLALNPVTPPYLKPPVENVLSEADAPLLRAELLCGRRSDKVSKSDSKVTPLANNWEANTSAGHEGSGSKKKGLKLNDF